MVAKTQIYLDDKLIDLSQDNPIALTFQINDLGEARNQQGNTSNQFSIPDTQINRAILGYPNDLNFNDPSLVIQKPYNKYKARIIQNGIEILPNAFAELTDPAYDSGQFNIVILSGNVDFFDQLGGQLYDMGDSTSQWSNYGAKLLWKPFDHIFNLSNVANSQKNTNNSGNNTIGGWIYPVVDYGLFTENYEDRIDVRYQRPGFFIKTAIDLLLKYTGYKSRGTLLKNPLYPKLIAQFSNSSFDHGSDYANQPDTRGMSASQTQQRIINHPTVANPTGVLSFPTVTSDPSNQFSGGTTYKSKSINSIQINLTIPALYLRGRVTPVEYSSKFLTHIVIRQPGYPDVIAASYTFSFDGYGEGPGGWNRISGNGGNIVGDMNILNAKLSYQTTVPANAEVFIQYEFQGFTGSMVNVYPTSLFEIKSQNTIVEFGQSVQCERIFPDVSQKDLLKDTLQRFGIICQTDVYSATINFASLGEIVNNIPLAKDWTDKCIDQGKQVSTKLGDYNQVNYLEYQVDPNGGKRQIPQKYAWSQINVKDKTLPLLAKDLIVSIFGASLNRNYYGGTIAQIQMIDPDDLQKQLSISVAPRILIDQKLDLTQLGKTVTFTDDITSSPTDPAHNVVVNDIISVPYFWKPGVDKKMSLLWEDLRLLYYPELEKILSNTKKVVRYFQLSPQDIVELDLLIPIFLKQDSCFYYINKIDAWVEDVPTKVTLIKIG